MARVTGRHVAAGAAAIVIATGLIAGFESFVDHVYPDPATHGAPWSYCYGETADPRPGHTYTRAECDAQLAGRVAEFDAGVRSCVHAPLPIKTEAAMVSMAHNIGIGAFCSSTLARKASAGDLTGACNEMPRWNRAAGKVMRGLTVRRGEERALCLEGVAEGLP